MTEIPQEGATPIAEPTLPRRVTARTGTERFRTIVEARGHELTSDEPAALGGGDSGPTPFDLLCAALATCTTITVRMYADRKAWPLQEVEAHVEHSRVPAARDDGSATQVDRFTLRMELTGDLDEAQRNRLLEIAGKCPVHRLLVAGAIVEMGGA